MTLTDLNHWAAQWAPCMLRACWQGAIAVGCVWLICRLFPRLHPSVRATLWWLACLKMLLSLVTTGPLHLAILPAEAPPTVISAPSIPVLASSSAPPRNSVSEVAVIDAALLPLSQVPTTNHAADAVPLSQIENAPERIPVSPTSVVLCLWLVGVTFLLVIFCREWRSVRRLAAQAGPCPEPTAAQEVARAIGLAQPPPVLISERADCSLVVGPWRPAVVLCRADLERLSGKEQRALLAHELAHIRRRDLWAGFLPNVVRLLFFFHPLVWLACREYDLAREAACDAEALRVSGLAPADYGRLLLKLSITPQYSGVAALGAASPYGILLRRRLHGLMKLGDGSSALSRWTSLLALAATVGALSLHPVRAGVGAVSAEPSPQTQPEVQDSNHPAPPVGGWAEKVAKARGVHNHPANVPNTTNAVADETSVLSLLLPQYFLAPPEFPAQGKFPATTISPMNPPNKKEDQPMSNVSNGRKPKVSTALAAVALATAGMSTLFAAPVKAQEAPPAPAPPTVPIPPVTPVAPVVPVVVEVPNVVVAPVEISPGLFAQDSRYQYTLRRGNSYMNHTKDKAVGTAQRELAKAQPGDCLVVDRDGKRYLITDADTLRKIQDNFAPVEALGKQMEAKGKEMEAIGKPMEDIGKQMEAIGKKMEEIGKKMEEQGELLGKAFEEGKPEAERKAIQDQMQALQEQMKVPHEEIRAFSQKMKDQAAKMRPLGDQMRELGNQMRAAVKAAMERMNGIIDDAFKNNLAVEQKTP